MKITDGHLQDIIYSSLFSSEKKQNLKKNHKVADLRSVRACRSTSYLDGGLPCGGQRETHNPSMPLESSHSENSDSVSACCLVRQMRSS